jgi:hypothetical protein
MTSVPLSSNEFIELSPSSDSDDVVAGDSLQTFFADIDAPFINYAEVLAV